MIASVVSSIDEPFRQPWYKNKLHLIAFVFQGENKTFSTFTHLIIIATLAMCNGILIQLINEMNESINRSINIFIP